MIDFDRLPKAQQEAIGWIAINEYYRVKNKSIIEALLKKGLIEEYVEQLRDKLGAFEIKKYSVPLHIHAQWCYWCSKQEDPKDERD